MKIFYMLLISILGVISCYGKLALDEPESGFLYVKNNYYVVKFFPGYMLPFEFEVKNAGKIQPFTYNDRLYDKETKRIYFLKKDRCAERKILLNTDEQAVIEISGTYCLDSEIAVPGKVNVVYRYTFYKKSPFIWIEAKIDRNKSQMKAALWFFHVAWHNPPYKQIVLGNSNKVQPFTRSYFKQKEIYLVHNNIVFGMKSAKPTIRAYVNKEEKYHAYLEADMTHLWKGTKLNFSISLYVSNLKAFEKMKKLPKQ